MTEPEIKQAVREVISEEMAAFRTLMPVLQEMSDNYKAAIKIGKWMSGVVIFVSVALGIWTAIKQLFKP